RLFPKTSHATSRKGASSATKRVSLAGGRLPDVVSDCMMRAGLPRMAGILYVVATPIGNLSDVTLRALDVLRGVALVACEDTRQTRKLLVRHGIEATLVSCHKFNERRSSGRVLEALRSGSDVALVTDGGTPAISDP